MRGYSKKIEEGWVRSDEAIELPDNANNPAVIDDGDGNILLYFRDGRLKVSVGRAKSYDEKFEIVNDNLFDKGMIEDMFLFKKDGNNGIFQRNTHLFRNSPRMGLSRRTGFLLQRE